MREKIREKGKEIADDIREREFRPVSEFLKEMDSLGSKTILHSV